MPRPHEVLMVEDAWCPECHEQSAVEIVVLLGDPEPVAICVVCNGGVELSGRPAQAARDIPPPLVARAS